MSGMEITGHLQQNRIENPVSGTNGKKMFGLIFIYGIKNSRSYTMVSK